MWGERWKARGSKCCSGHVVIVVNVLFFVFCVVLARRSEYKGMEGDNDCVCLCYCWLAYKGQSIGGRMFDVCGVYKVNTSVVVMVVVPLWWLWRAGCP